MTDLKQYIDTLEGAINSLRCKDCKGECDISAVGCCITKDLEELKAIIESECE